MMKFATVKEFNGKGFTIAFTVTRRQRRWLKYMHARTKKYNAAQSRQFKVIVIVAIYEVA